MKRLSFAIVLLLALVSCDSQSVLDDAPNDAAPSSAVVEAPAFSSPVLNPKTGERPVATQITWGQPTGSAFGNVGFLVINNALVCTGTLVAQKWVLTAAHCLVEADEPSDVWVSFQQQLSLSPATKYEAAAIHVHPMYATHGQDVGLVELAEDPGITPALLPQGDVFDGLSTRRGLQSRKFTVVGYGMNSVVPRVTWSGLRFYGTVSLVEVTSLYGMYNFARVTGNPGLGNGVGGTCYGDSGGPAFLGNTNTVVAVTSWGNSPNCTGGDYLYRVDTDVARGWLASFL